MRTVGRGDTPFAYWQEPGPPWGTYIVRLIGRISVGRHWKRYLEDAAIIVLIEELVSVQKSR